MQAKNLPIVRIYIREYHIQKKKVNAHTVPKRKLSSPGCTNCATFSFESECNALEIASELAATGLKVTELNCLQPRVRLPLGCRIAVL